MQTDLVTQMVYEFPELQGIMGEKYARLSGESLKWPGIAEHYTPFAGDSLPETVTGKVVGLADKLDTLVGYFALGKIPTGSQILLPCAGRPKGCADSLANSFDVALGRLVDLANEGYQGVSLTAERRGELVSFLLARLRCTSWTKASPMILWMRCGFRRESGSQISGESASLGGVPHYA